MPRVVSSALFVWLVVHCAPAAAPDVRGEAAARTWTSHDGRHTTEAVFTGFQEGKVQLRKEDGSTVEVPLIQLSEDDQEHVRQTAEDDPQVVEALTERKVELERDDDGRVVAAVYPVSSRVDRRDIELLSGLPNLQRLSLAQTRTAEGTFEEIKHLPNLRQLDLTATPVGNADVKYVADLKRLEALSLSDTRITNRALSYLKELPKLSELALANTRIGDEGIAYLEEVQTLKKLDLGNVRVSPQGVLRLRKALPNAAMEGSGVVRRR